MRLCRVLFIGSSSDNGNRLRPSNFCHNVRTSFGWDWHLPQLMWLLNKLPSQNRVNAFSIVAAEQAGKGVVPEQIPPSPNTLGQGT